MFDRAWFRKYESRLITVVLAIGFVHGLVFVYLMPPWQHYDEPMHFEYAWWIADRGELPIPEIYDDDFRSDLVRSMIEHDFYKGGGLRVPDPDNLVPLPAGLQFPQLDDPPLYYLLASIPVSMVESDDLADKLIAARWVSLLLLVVTLLAAYGAVSEITSAGSPLRIFVPLTMALLPSFVDLMTAVNNDVGAVAVFSLFLWGSLRLIQHGPTTGRISWVAATAVAAFFTKSTAFLAVPLALVALVLGLLPGRARRIAWVVLAAAALAGTLVLIYRAEPAYWYRATSQLEPIRLAYEGAPHGSHVLRLDPRAPVTPRWLSAINQPLTQQSLKALPGKTLTLGVWMWFEPRGSEAIEIQARLPAINADLLQGADPTFFETVTLTRTPRFYAFRAEVPAETVRLWITLFPRVSADEADVWIYYDAFVLAEGAFPLEEAPTAMTAGGDVGEWAGVRFENLLRNASAEESWPAFRPWADNFAARLLPSNVRPTILLYSLFDGEGAGFYYLGAGANIFETFWARYGWAHVRIPAYAAVNQLMAGLTLLAVVGVGAALASRRGRLPLDALIFLSLTLVAVWMAAFARGAIFIFVDHVFIPSARYAYPAMIPTVLLLVAGWFGLFVPILRRMKVPVGAYYGLYLAFFLVFDFLAIWGIISFYAA